ncbi:hypothetical protein EGW08_000493 [Elysia chlorotica]|uniref:Methyltransferase-like protein 9 n=1 Tax=Elysia chlorotica TaxID=188477 RepID=A0A3S1BY49_ELYCH|nr:hypothetical protein EGW08_000493 [Elysia chlorotica]
MTCQVSSTNKADFKYETFTFCLSLLVLLIRVTFGQETVDKEELQSQFKMSDDNSMDSRFTAPRAVAQPYIRSSLARAVYYKFKEDEQNQNDRHVYWYRAILSRLSQDLCGKFVQFDQDDGADEFLQNCQEKSDAILSQIFYSLARPILNVFMTQTSINGLLRRGSMYIFSKPQFEQLMNYTAYHKQGNLLDLGAGDGMVTAQMSSYFNQTYATEMSGVMARKLSSMGYHVLDVDQWAESGLKFDVVSCLNLLDRCDKPMSLLAQIRKVLSPDTGRLLVATVIPFKPYVEFNSKTHEPSEFLRVTGSNFEEQVDQLVSIFRQAGFVVEKFTRLPYLCEGDLRHSFYVLTDALFVLKAAEETTAS